MLDHYVGNVILPNGFDEFIFFKALLTSAVAMFVNAPQNLFERKVLRLIYGPVNIGGEERAPRKEQYTMSRMSPLYPFQLV